MEATTLLTLILLTVVGARNIPGNMDEPSGKLQQMIGDSITSNANTVPKDEVFYKDPVEDTDSAGDVEPTSNKDINGEKTAEDRDHNVAAMDTEEAKNLENEPKKADNQESTAAINPVEVTKGEKEGQTGFEDRVFDGKYCPGAARVGTDCWPPDKSSEEEDQNTKKDEDKK